MNKISTSMNKISIERLRDVL